MNFDVLLFEKKSFQTKKSANGYKNIFRSFYKLTMFDIDFIL